MLLPPNGAHRPGSGSTLHRPWPHDEASAPLLSSVAARGYTPLRLVSSVLHRIRSASAAAGPSRRLQPGRAFLECLMRTTRDLDVLLALQRNLGHPLCALTMDRWVGSRHRNSEQKQ